MIKKKYFPTQEVPARVKDRVMRKISGGTKTFRLLSLVRYKFMVSALVLLFIVTGGYLYFQLPRDRVVVSTLLSGDTTTISTSTTVQTNTVVTTTQVITNSPSDEYLLQQKLAEAELALNDLSDYANQEENITL